MDILPGKPFYVYVVNMTAKPVDLPKLMIVACALNSPTCIIHVRDYEPHMFTYECSIPTQ